MSKLTSTEELSPFMLAKISLALNLCLIFLMILLLLIPGKFANMLTFELKVQAAHLTLVGQDHPRANPASGTRLQMDHTPVFVT